MAALAPVEEQLKCPICLELLSSPVSTPCGHNFCLNCISRHWDLNMPCKCPICKHIYHLRPTLLTNTPLSELVSQVKASHSPKGRPTNSPQGRPEVPFDMCQSPALKSCLVCMVFYCELHLNPHRSIPRLKRHQLIDPVQDLDTRTCQDHNKPLELFCSTDQTLVCTICPLLQHKDHHFVSLKEEFDKGKVILTQNQSRTKTEMVQKRLKIQEIQRSVERSQKAADKEIDLALHAYTALIKSIEKSKDQFLNQVQTRLNQVCQEAQVLIDQLQEEISKLKDKMTEMEKISATEDHLLFIQKYTSMRPVLDQDQTKTRPNADQEKSQVCFKPGFIKVTSSKTLSDLQDSVRAEFKELLKVELKTLQQFFVDITLDPSTAHPELVLSGDLRQVYHGTNRSTKKVEDALNNQRFTKCLCVLGKQSFSSGRFYYEVQVQGKTVWDLGVVQKSINRTTDVKASPEQGYWIIILRNGQQYMDCEGRGVHLYLTHAPEKVGVYVDYDEGLVSFYGADTACLIYSFINCAFTDKPFWTMFECRSELSSSSYHRAHKIC